MRKEPEYTDDSPLDPASLEVVACFDAFMQWFEVTDEYLSNDTDHEKTKRIRAYIAGTLKGLVSRHLKFNREEELVLKALTNKYSRSPSWRFIGFDFSNYSGELPFWFSKGWENGWRNPQVTGKTTTDGLETLLKEYDSETHPASKAVPRNAVADIPTHVPRPVAPRPPETLFTPNNDDKPKRNNLFTMFGFFKKNGAAIPPELIPHLANAAFIISYKLTTQLYPLSIKKGTAAFSHFYGESLAFAASLIQMRAQRHFTFKNPEIDPSLLNFTTFLMRAFRNYDGSGWSEWRIRPFEGVPSPDFAFGMLMPECESNFVQSFLSYSSGNYRDLGIRESLFDVGVKELGYIPQQLARSFEDRAMITYQVSMSLNLFGDEKRFHQELFDTYKETFLIQTIAHTNALVQSFDGLLTM